MLDLLSPGGLVGVGVVGKCVSKENLKSDFDFDLGFVNNNNKTSWG